MDLNELYNSSYINFLCFENCIKEVDKARSFAQNIDFVTHFVWRKCDRTGKVYCSVVESYKDSLYTIPDGCVSAWCVQLKGTTD